MKSWTVLIAGILIGGNLGFFLLGMFTSSKRREQMPRYNENARSRGPIANGRWRMAELRSVSEYLNLKELETRNRPHSTIKTTPEQIVRDFRRSEGFNISQEANMVRPLCRKLRRPIFFVRWWKAINWDFFYGLGGKIFEWTCIILAIVCLIYVFGFIIFGPFTLKLFHR